MNRNEELTEIARNLNTESLKTWWAKLIENKEFEEAAIFGNEFQQRNG